jgi:hypothetical protein
VREPGSSPRRPFHRLRCLQRPASSRAARSLGLVDVSRSAAQSFVEARASSRKEGSMGILWIILIVVVVLALLGFFGFRR